MTTVVLNTVTRKVEVFSSARDVHARAEIADHKAAANPHPQYLADADLAEVALSGDASDLASGTVPDARMPNWTGYNLASRTALEAANVPAAIVGLRLLGHATVGDGAGARYKRVTSEPAHPHKIQSADGAWWEEIFAVDVTVNIPSEYATLQEAIDRLSKQPVRRGARIILNIESGHAPASGIQVVDGDYGRFWVQSADAEVSLDTTWPDSESFIYGNNARLPVLDCLINAGSKGLVGIWANNASSVHVTSGSGIKNWGNAASGLTHAGQAIRVAHGSTAALGETVFSGAGSHGIRGTQGVTIFASAADISNAGGHALMLSRGTVFHGHDMNLSGAGEAAIRAARSYASVRGSHCQNAGTYGIWAFEGSIVAARGANCSGAGIDGVHCFQGGAYVDIDAGTVSSCTGRGILATDGSTVVATGATINENGTTGISANDGSKVACVGATISENVGRALWITDGASINARDVVIDATGSGGTNTVEVARGGYACLTNATITNSPGHGVNFADGARGDLTSASITGSTTKDIVVEDGSIVSARNCTTSTSGTSGNHPDSADVAPTTFNAISSRGILFA